MAGLIPLMLAPVVPGTRDGTAPPARTPAHSRNYSTGSMPCFPQPPKHKTMRRQSQSAPPTLPALPHTPAEWKKAVGEVKRQHLNRRNRACAARCNEILTNVKDTTNVEPTYLIYLHFYAATSLETCARPLQLSSTYRTSLMQQARIHYGQAATLIQKAEDSVGTSSPRRGSLASTTSRSSLHTPTGSLSSVSWASETSPVRSPVSALKCQQRPQSPKPKKKVSFELPHGAKDDSQQDWSFPVREPLIRPDSPTLGFDDEYLVAAAAAARPLLPAAPPLLDDLSSPSSSEDSSDSDEDCCYSASSSPPSADDSAAASLSALLVSRSVGRYRAHLSVLKTQVIGYISALDAALIDPPPPHTSRRRASSAPAGAAGNASSGSSSSNSSSDNDNDSKALERTARIERLRQTGWQRKRFDARRYEALCDAVMAELD